jgi:predicted DNA-binding transcriptional regulator AlpA
MNDRQYNKVLALLIEINDKLETVFKQQEKELLPLDEVCRMLKISKRTCFRLVKSGHLHPVKQGAAVNSPSLVKKSEIKELGFNYEDLVY